MPSGGPIQRGSHQGGYGRLGNRGEGRGPLGQEGSQPGGAGGEEGAGLHPPGTEQGLPRHRPLCPWLPSQGQTFAGGAISAGAVRGQVGAAQVPLSPAAGGRLSRSQAKGQGSADGEVRVQDEDWGQASPDVSLCRVLRALWARPAVLHTSCVALGGGLSPCHVQVVQGHWAGGWGLGRLQFRRRQSRAHSEGGASSLRVTMQPCALATAWGSPAL